MLESWHAIPKARWEKKGGEAGRRERRKEHVGGNDGKKKRWIKIDARTGAAMKTRGKKGSLRGFLGGWGVG